MPFLCKHAPVDLPAGYQLIRICRNGQPRCYLVYCEATQRFVGNRREYQDMPRAVLAAKRSAWMVRYRAMCA